MTSWRQQEIETINCLLLLKMGSTISKSRVVNTPGSASKRANSSAKSENISPEQGSLEANDLQSHGQEVKLTGEVDIKLDDEGNICGVNRFRFLDKLGKGATATVYKATANEKRFVAVKVMNKQFLRNKRVGQFQSALDDARSEIELWQRLFHPNVVKLQEVIDSKDSEHIFLVSELVEGQSLMPAQALECEPKDEATVRQVFKQLVNGISYMHEQGVVHNDLKPENLLQETKTGKILIADFGSAQDIVKAESPDNADSLRANTTMMFTPPEVLDQEPGDTYSLRPTDIWAAGVTLYMLLYGRPPYEGDDFFELTESVLEGKLKFPSSPVTSDAAKQLIRSMLCHDPDARISVHGIMAHPFYLDED